MAELEKGMAEELISCAEKMLEYSYAPYSGFKVGAALLASDGRIFTGCNVENSSYGAACCAERTAVFKAVSEGAREFSAIAIVSSSGEYTYPCGICRQVLFEFGADIKVILKGSGGTKITTVSELLPEGFKLQAEPEP
ncbi:MAG: cytidine deaminase [Huintestinicola sp.]